MRSIALAFGLFCLGSPVRSSAQTGDVEAAKATITRWLGLVSGGTADITWNEASPFFQYRITELQWRDWVHANASQLSSAGPRRDLEFSVGHDEPPLAPLNWVRAVYARTRPAGGRLIEQIVVIEDGGRWRVAHYGAWMDNLALVSNGSIFPVPYNLQYRGQYTFSEFPWRSHVGRPFPPTAPPPAERPSNVVNPRTFPKRPPPR